MFCTQLIRYPKYRTLLTEYIIFPPPIFIATGYCNGEDGTDSRLCSSYLHRRLIWYQLSSPV